MNDNQLRQIKLKVSFGAMLKFIENAAHTFNNEQSSGEQTVMKKVEKLGQCPWCEGNDDQFIQHLNKLKDFARFKLEVIDNIEGNDHAGLDGSTFVSA